MLISRIFLALVALASAGCATKLRFPLNRMVSPEAVGGVMNGEVEIGRMGQANGKVDASEEEPFPLEVKQQMAMSWFAALSFFDGMDGYWQHTASGPSMFGARWQFIGNRLTQGGAGNSLAVTAAIGGNEHETDSSPKIEFEVASWDASLIHGYWITPFWQVFETLAYASHSVQGDLKGAGGGDFKENGKFLTFAAGTALHFRPLKLKLEYAHVQAKWSGAESGTISSLAFSLGYSF